MEIKLLSHSPAQTQRFGEILAQALPYPAVVALYGELAAGKTALSGAILTTLGFGTRFTSPTYTIINEYHNAQNELAAHMDAYRLAGSDELAETGWYDFLDEAKIIIVEWAGIIEDALPDYTVRITINSIDEQTRQIAVSTKDFALFALLGEKLDEYTCD